MIFLNNKSTLTVIRTYYSFIFFTLNKYLNIQVLAKIFGLFNFSFGILMFSGLFLRSMIINLSRPVKGNKFSWFPLLILNNFIVTPVPEEQFALFHFSLGVLILIVAILGAIFNILLTIALLYYKDKYNLELKLQNYPRIVRIVKFYQKASYLTIAFELFWVLLFALIILANSLFMVLRITNII